MPIYEFQCEACHEVSEFIMKINEPAPTACPLCEKGTLKKIMSRPSHLGKLTNEGAEYEAHAMKQGSEFKYSKKIPANYVKDKEGHWVPMDPADPKLKEIKAAEEKTRLEKIAKGKKAMDEAG